MREYESSTLFGGNVPFIEEQYEHYLANPAAVTPDWRAYFDSLRGGAADVAHAPVDRVVHPARAGAARSPARWSTPSTMHKQVLVLQMIGHFRTLGMFHAELDPLKRQEKPLHRRPRPRDLRLHRGRPRHRVRRRLVQGGRRADAPARPDRGAEGHVLPHVRRRVHVHQRHGDQALRPGAPRADPLAADVPGRAAAAHPRAADRRRDARALPAHQVRRPEALLGRGRRDDDPDARPPDPDRRRRRRAGDGDRHGAPRAASTCWSTRWARCRRTCSPSSRASRRRSCSPATSSTTRASRRTSSRRAGRCT